jgi:proline dehydrogenase
MKLFDNTEVAFALKSYAQLERAYFLFKMIQNQLLVRIGTFITNVAFKLHLPVEGIVRATVFNHFCGGISEDDCLPVIDEMYTKRVHSVLDYSVEGKNNEEEFDKTVDKVLRVLNFCEERKSIPFAVFKPSGFGRFSLYQKISEKKELTAKENLEWLRVIARFHTVCKVALEKDIPVLIDSEESWMQDAADFLIEDMMETYNKEKAIVFNTLQMYRHDRMAYLKAVHLRSQEKGYFLGMKVVRGAYMEKERNRAEEKGYNSPICSNKKETDDNYDMALVYMMEHKDMAVFAGTHNEDSSLLLMNLSKKHNIDPSNQRLWFGQLYGMSDHISFNLAGEGYNVAKYLPFGPVRDVMPYLIRRAAENTSVAGQTSRELNLLNTERKRRSLQ